MNSAVGNELFKRKSCNFAPYGVEARKNYNLGGVVDYKLDTRRILDCADISALAPDKSCFHIVARQLYDRDGNFRSVVGGTTLHGERNYFLRFVCCLVFCRLLDIPYLKRHVVTRLVNNFVGKNLLRLFFRELCDLFQLLNHQFVLMVYLLLCLL